MNNQVKRNIGIGVLIFLAVIIFVKPVRYIFYGIGGLLIIGSAAIIVFAYYMFRKHNLGTVSNLLNSIQEEQKEKEEYINRNNEVISKIALYDQNFSYEEFKKLVEKVIPLYIKARNYNENGIEDLRMYSSKAFIEDYIRELEKLKSESMYSYSAVLISDIALQEVSQSGNNILLKTGITLRADVSKYNDKSVLVKRSTVTQMYDASFIKTQEDTSVSQDRDVMVNCPNCGAPVHILSEKTCSHCGSAIYAKQNMWVLHNVTQYRNN